MKRGGLTDKQRAFCREMVVDWNATQAAIRAGYSAKTAAQTAHRLLRNVNVGARIRKLAQAAAHRNDITVDRVLEEHRRIAFANLSDIIEVRDGIAYAKDFAELGPEQLAVIERVHQGPHGVTVSLHDKTRSLDSLARYLGLFTDNVVLHHQGPPPILNIEFTNQPQVDQDDPEGVGSGDADPKVE